MQMNVELFHQLSLIADDEVKMSKLLSFIKQLTKPADDDALIDKTEYMESLERGEQEYRQGKCVRLQPGESVSDMLRRSGL